MAATLRFFGMSIACTVFLAEPSAAEFPSSWRDAKNTAADEVYFDREKTFYCGCPYVSDNDDDGSGKVDLASCGMEPLRSYASSAKVIQWEHIVPASLMPVRLDSCWDQSRRFSECVAKSGNVVENRDCCVRTDERWRNMILDLHNLAPAIGQVNQYRKNGRYGLVGDGAEMWPGCEARDLGGTRNGAAYLFEPPDCVKGDVARVWLYMADVHGVVITQSERRMFEDWSVSDAVSPQERKRDMRIERLQGNSNPYVSSQLPMASGKCAWE